MSQSEPLSVSELFASYLNRQIEAHARGVGFADAGGDAAPFDASPARPTDPGLAWSDAVAAAMVPVGWPAPPDWPSLVAQREPAVAVAFCLGNYPQLVRDLHPLLTGEAAALGTQPREPIGSAELLGWLGQPADEPRRYLAAGVARLACRFDMAENLLAAEASPAWRPLRENEAAALAWHAGRTDKALAMWRAQADSAPVLFNRGMAALFLGDAALAADSLRAAAALLPESSAWHHLAGLYLAFAASR